jgi:endonuclease YncB( thermonuclease family)
VQGTARGSRTLAICFEAGEDLNAIMVLDGHAVA